MLWENILHRLNRVLKTEVSLPSGKVWLIDSGYLSIDDWLTSAADTDEELMALDMPRIQFLRNRWTIENILRLGWRGKLGVLSVWVMFAGGRGYILLYNGLDYQLIGAVEPHNRPELYALVISRLLQDRHVMPELPDDVRNRRPDLVPSGLLRNLRPHEKRRWLEEEERAEQIPLPFGGENFGGEGGPVDWMYPGGRRHVA